MNGKPDAVVVGSGPNGLAGALRLAAAGLRVQVLEQADRPGGGMRTEELTRPGYRHDVCSTVQPMAAAAPFFREFDLPSRGVRLVQPEICYAHPLDGGRAAVSRRSLAETADGLGADGAAYRRLFEPLVEHGTDVIDFFLTSQLRRPPTKSVAQIVHFALNGLPNVRWLARRYFDTVEGQALLAGAAAHGMLDLARPLTASLGMLLGMLAHHVGWPLVEGGSQALADAMVTALEEQGGEVLTGHEVTDLRDARGRRPAQLRGQEEVDDVGAVLHQGLEQPPVGVPVRPQALGGLLQGTAGHRRPTAVEGVGVGDLGLDQPDPPAGQVELPEERRRRGHRLHHRAHVVPVAGAGQLLGAHAPAGTVGLLDHLDPQSGGCQPQRAGQPVGPRSDDDGVRTPVHRSILAG